MYKVFFEKNYFNFSKEFPQGKELVFNKDTLNTMLSVLLENLRRDEAVEINVFDADIEEAFSIFSKYFKLIEAGGGVVENPEGKIILIYRNGIWDLPKGKKEPGEPIEITALREVKEEVGINELEPIEFIDYSYHIYRLNDEWVLKKTAWYTMKTEGQPELTPQTIEGIEKAIWINIREISDYISNMYPSIVDVLQKYLDSKLKQKNKIQKPLRKHIKKKT